MTKVTNNHKGLLNVAGVGVRPGAEVEVDETAFKQWSHGNAAKIWLEQGLVTSNTKGDAPKSKKGDKDGGANDRSALEGRASALGIAFTAETSDEDLTNAVAEAEQKAADGEREALLKQARDLGLNPNANTGTEKLKKLIAEKQNA